MADATDLKSVRASSSVWVRIPSSAPSKERFYEGKSIKIAGRIDCAASRNKTHEMAVYLPSICQVSLQNEADAVGGLTAWRVSPYQKKAICLVARDHLRVVNANERGVARRGRSGQTLRRCNDPLIDFCWSAAARNCVSKGDFP